MLENNFQNLSENLLHICHAYQKPHEKFQIFIDLTTDSSGTYIYGEKSPYGQIGSFVQKIYQFLHFNSKKPLLSERDRLLSALEKTQNSYIKSIQYIEKQIAEHEQNLLLALEGNIDPLKVPLPLFKKLHEWTQTLGDIERFYPEHISWINTIFQKVLGSSFQEVPHFSLFRMKSLLSLYHTERILNSPLPLEALGETLLHNQISSSSKENLKILIKYFIKYKKELDPNHIHNCLVYFAKKLLEKRIPGSKYLMRIGKVERMINDKIPIFFEKIDPSHDSWVKKVHNGTISLHPKIKITKLLSTDSPHKNFYIYHCNYPNTLIIIPKHPAKLAMRLYDESLGSSYSCYLPCGEQWGNQDIDPEGRWKIYQKMISPPNKFPWNSSTNNNTQYLKDFISEMSKILS